MARNFSNIFIGIKLTVPSGLDLTEKTWVDISPCGRGLGRGLGRGGHPPLTPPIKGGAIFVCAGIEIPARNCTKWFGSPGFPRLWRGKNPIPVLT